LPKNRFRLIYIHDDMTFKVIRGQGQGQEMTSVPYRDYILFLPTYLNKKYSFLEF